VSPKASPVFIKTRYIELCRKHHPDVSKNAANSHAKMIEINAAYEAIQKSYKEPKPTVKPTRPQYEPYANYQNSAHNNTQHNSRSTHKKNPNHYGIYYVNYQNGQQIPLHFWMTLIVAMCLTYFGMMTQSRNVRALMAREQKIKEAKKLKEQAEHEGHNNV
jgi:hypothetical protein